MTYTDAILNADVVTLQYNSGFYKTVDTDSDPIIKPEPDVKPEPTSVNTSRVVPSTSISTFVQNNSQPEYLLVAMLIMTLMIVMVAVAVVKKNK